MLVRGSLIGLVVVCLVACGSKPSSTRTVTTATPPAATTTVASGPGALQAEVAGAAAGDIPDNQVFVTYPGASFTIKYPEGWTQSGGGKNVTFRDKNNIVRVVIGHGKPGTAKLVGGTITARAQPVTIGALHGVKLTYRTTSAPDPVTGKRVTLTVDRYELGGGGTLTTIDLGTPVGVDNVDAYRLMVHSFRQR
jgi:hypothetical protein